MKQKEIMTRLQNGEILTKVKILSFKYGKLKRGESKYKYYFGESCNSITKTQFLNIEYLLTRIDSEILIETYKLKQ